MVLYQLNNSPLNIFIQWFLNTFFFLSSRCFGKPDADQYASIVGVRDSRIGSERRVSWGRPYGWRHPSFVHHVLGLDQPIALNRPSVVFEDWIQAYRR